MSSERVAVDANANTTKAIAENNSSSSSTPLRLQKKQPQLLNVHCLHALEAAAAAAAVSNAGLRTQAQPHQHTHTHTCKRSAFILQLTLPLPLPQSQSLLPFNTSVTAALPQLRRCPLLAASGAASVFSANFERWPPFRISQRAGDASTRQTAAFSVL